MPGVAVVCDAGDIADVPGVGNAACVADDSYARHGVAVSVRGLRDGLPLVIPNIMGTYRAHGL